MLTALDWFALGFALLTGLLGARRGFLATALSTAGVLLGAILGARLAPHLLNEGSSSPYTPLVALAGAGALAVAFEAVGATVGFRIRSAFPLTLYARSPSSVSIQKSSPIENSFSRIR